MKILCPYLVALFNLHPPNRHLSRERKESKRLEDTGRDLSNRARS